MHLAEFIARDMEAILSQWESFARTVPVGSFMGRRSFATMRRSCRPYARTSSRARPRTSRALEVAKGLAEPLNAKETARADVCALRARHGFDINQMASEYRACAKACSRRGRMRALLVTWTCSRPSRFNEADRPGAGRVDPVLQCRGRPRSNLLLGILGYDMRSPRK